MELHLAARLRRSFPAWDISDSYVERIPMPAGERRLLASRAAGQGTGEVREAMMRVHAGLAGADVKDANAENPASVSIKQRLLAQYRDLPEPVTANTSAGFGGVRLRLAPPIVRSTMAPVQWPPLRRYSPRGDFSGRNGSTSGGTSSTAENPDDVASPDRHVGAEHEGQPRCADNAIATGLVPPGSPDAIKEWHHTGNTRRFLLLAMIVVQTYFATGYMAAVLPYHGERPLEIAILALFALLSAWISAGFWTALMGFWVQVTGRDKFAISATAAPDTPIDASARTAVVMPICNEDVARVFAGLRATYESLAATGEGRHFDFFVLSDSSDADTRVAEVSAWTNLCRTVKGFDHIFYRWRKHRIKRKSGNVADFCRRWGANYRYMVVLDADSVMSGECLTRLTQLMEANPNAGIIQTAPRASGRETLYARIQQFASRVYGPLFVAGLHYWQLGESHYWGHNAIIRVKPFLRHCALGRLPGRGPLSGEILSHDFVEAALMRRAGWGVWIAYDLPGSFEEMPPNLVDELKRDRRWCQGNLMNFRLFLAKGLNPAHRAVFMTGVVAYVSAPLWFLFLVLATAQLAVHTLSEPTYFVQPFQLFPIWPEWHPDRAMGLFAATASMLFLPKVLSVLLLWREGSKLFGGGWRLAVSMVGEVIFSALLAPIRMLFHTHFVVGTLLGRKIQWKSPPRDDAETSWGEAFRRHGLHTVLGVAWAAGVYWLNPSYLWWLLPVVGALALSMPISVFSSRVSMGRSLRKLRLFLIPEEANPPRELRSTEAYTRRTPQAPGFLQAVMNPSINALMCATGTAPSMRFAPANELRRQLVRAAVVGGPQGLDSAQKMQLLSDTVALSQLHFEVWASEAAHPAWREERTPHPEAEPFFLTPITRHATT